MKCIDVVLDMTDGYFISLCQSKKIENEKVNCGRVPFVSRFIVLCFLVFCQTKRVTSATDVGRCSLTRTTGTNISSTPVAWTGETVSSPVTSAAGHLRRGTVCEFTFFTFTRNTGLISASPAARASHR